MCILFDLLTWTSIPLMAFGFSDDYTKGKMVTGSEIEEGKLTIVPAVEMSGISELFGIYFFHNDSNAHHCYIV